MLVFLTDRQVNIINKLLGANEYFTIGYIARSFNVSSRTVRYDLQMIRTYLNTVDVTLISKPNCGIRIVCTDEAREKLLSSLSSSRLLNSIDRAGIIKLFLLIKQHTTYDKLKELCDVSKKTIISDFEEIILSLQSEGIQVIREKGIGVRIQGNENIIRKKFFEILKTTDLENTFVKSVLSEIDSDISHTIAKRIIRTAEEAENIRFYNHKYIEEVLCYIMFRTGMGFELTDFDDDCHTVDFLKEIPLSVQDKKMICAVLKNSSRRPVTTDMMQNEEEVSKKIADYLEAQLEKLHPLSKDERKRFISGLSTHLKVAINRINSGFHIRNELLEQIQISIPLLYAYTAEQLKKCTQPYSISFNENEIAYIAMYVASAYENSIKEDAKTVVLLSCQFGLTTSSILKTRIEQLIPESSIIGPLSGKESEEYLKANNVDLIVTTSRFRIKKVPVIEVNPLIDQDDMDKIKNALFHISYAKMCQTFLKSYSFQKKTKTRSIGDLIPAEHIQIVNECATWEEAIKIAAEPLLNEKLIQHQYAEKMIEAVYTLGTYMVLVPETAFVHAGTEDGINETCSSMLILKKPLVFGEKNPKTVRFVIILGIKEKDDNPLLDLVYIFENEENRNKLKESNISKEYVKKISL